MSWLFFFKICHWVGLLLTLAGAYCYFFTELTTTGVTGVLTVASLLGLGLLFMSPYPVVKFIQWAQDQKGPT